MPAEGFRTIATRLIVLLGTAALCACGASDHAPGAHATRTVHWDYEKEGPSAWAELSPDYALCAEGSRQSPIDLATPALGEPTIARIEFKAAPGVMAFNEHVEDIVDNGHTIQVSFDDSTVIELDGSEYELEQFHFHTPSEHSVDGEQFPMEAHFVHRDAAGRFLVSSVFFVAGAHNQAFDHLVTNLPGRGEARHVEHFETSLEEMAPGRALAYRYTGSLTTPPCLENVTWLVSVQPLEMSKEQLGAFATQLGHNARPIQPVNGRLLWAVQMVEVTAQ